MRSNRANFTNIGTTLAIALTIISASADASATPFTVVLDPGHFNLDINSVSQTQLEDKQ